MMSRVTFEATAPLVRAPHARVHQRPVGLVEFTLATMIATLYACDVLRQFLGSETGVPTASFRLATLGLYALTVVLLLPRLRGLLRLIARAPMLFVLLVLPLLSTLWSTSPNDTFVRGVTLLGSSLFGYYVALRFDTVGLLRLLSITALAVAVMSVVLIFGLPSRGVHAFGEWAGTWRGAFLHKNSLGGAMAFYSGFLVLLVMAGGGASRLRLLVTLAITLVLLAGSRSMTGVVAFAASLLSVYVLRSAFGRLRSYVLPALLVIAPLLIIPVLAVDARTLEAITAALGKDATFSGRIPIWVTSWPWIVAKFWTGYGYEAFWTDAQTGVRIIELQLFYRPFYSHNGIVELLLSLGFVGLTIFAGVLAIFSIRLVRLLARAPYSALAGLLVVFSVTFFVRNISEVAILSRNDLIWCLFVTFYLMLTPAQSPLLASLRRRKLVWRRGVAVPAGVHLPARAPSLHWTPPS